MLFSRQKLATLVAELFGTFILTMTILSVSKSAIGIPYFVAIGAGLALTILVLTIGKTSGAHVNPAVTFGLWTVRKISTVEALLYIAVQFMGAAFAWRLYTYFINGSIPNIAGKNFEWRILVAELIGTAIFTFGIAAAIYQKYEGGKLAAAIGGSLVIGIVCASAVSNGILNPAVALGVQSWSKEYVIGPLVGGVIGVNLYALLFAGEQFSLMPRKKETLVEKVTKKVTKKK